MNKRKRREMRENGIDPRPRRMQIGSLISVARVVGDERVNGWADGHPDLKRVLS